MSAYATKLKKGQLSHSMIHDSIQLATFFQLRIMIGAFPIVTMG